MSKEDVMDYVMTTPGNPNRAVLSGMLDSIAEASGSLATKIIKLGTAQSGYAAGAPSGWTRFDGGMTLASGTTLYDLIGDKPIIGYKAEFTDANGKVSSIALLSVTRGGTVGQDNPTIENLESIDVETRKLVTMIRVNGFLYNLTNSTSVSEPLSVDVSAICLTTA